MRLTSLWRLTVVLLFILPACKKDKIDPSNPPNNPGNSNSFSTGWNSQENFSQTIPVAINYGNYQTGSTLPASVDLTSQFPPVGNQGQLSTCVAWAVAYADKSY